MENDPAVSFQLKTAWYRKKERNVREITDRRIIWEQTKSDILVELGTFSVMTTPVKSLQSEDTNRRYY
jgi:hypothetical protein